MISMEAPSPSKNTAKTVAPFLKNLRQMLDQEDPSILRWSSDGCAIEILHMEKMMFEILPKYFKHKKYTSFQRQLNYFSFRKWTKSQAEVCTFSNKHFTRDNPSTSYLITRKRRLPSNSSKSDLTTKPLRLTNNSLRKPTSHHSKENKRPTPSSSNAAMMTTPTNGPMKKVITEMPTYLHEPLHQSSSFFKCDPMLVSNYDDGICESDWVDCFLSISDNVSPLEQDFLNVCPQDSRSFYSIPIPASGVTTTSGSATPTSTVNMPTFAYD